MHRSRRRRAAAALPAALLCLAAACGSAPQPEEPDEPDTPVRVQLVDGVIDVHNSQPDYEARFLTFERRGDRMAYGVYAAHLLKSHMRVAPPLDGEPIGWADRDHAQALAYLLELAGTPEEEARARVERGREEEWFGEGLRVFVVAPGYFRVVELDG